MTLRKLPRWKIQLFSRIHYTSPASAILFAMV